jgi:hypothetical protein
MTLYGRLTLTLLTAACGGATALAATAGTGVAPTLTWAVLLGGVLACTVLGARWVLHPLRGLAGELAEGPPPPADRAMEVLAHRVAELKARTTADEAHVEARVVERLADLVQGNQALSLLFVAVSADEPGLPAEDFAARLASRWVHEGRIHAAGVAWEQQGPVTVLSSGERRIGPDDVPRGLLSGLSSGGREGHPVEARTETLVWLAVGVPRAGDSRRAPAALLAAWPLAEPPTDADRVACAAVARYLGLRAAGAMQTTPVPAAPAPAPATDVHPARQPTAPKAE